MVVEFLVQYFFRLIESFIDVVKDKFFTDVVGKTGAVKYVVDFFVHAAQNNLYVMLSGVLTQTV